MKTARNWDRSESKRCGVDCQVDVHGNPTPSLTKQSMAEECDINVIVKRFGLSGQLPVGVRMPTFGDFTAVTDFQSALNAVREAEESFMAMPAQVRARFFNDAGAFVEFCSDDSNREEAIRLGLVEKPQAAPPPAAEPVVAPPVPGAPQEPRP